MPQGITVDGTNVYWTDEGDVRDVLGNFINSVPLDGGSLVTLATGDLTALPIAVDGTSLYWTNYLSGTVMKVSLDGGAPVTLASGQDSPVRIAIDGMTVYWVTQGSRTNSGTVMKVAVDGGAPVTIALGQSPPVDLAVAARAYTGRILKISLKRRSDRRTSTVGARAVCGRRLPRGRVFRDLIAVSRSE